MLEQRNGIDAPGVDNAGWESCPSAPEEALLRWRRRAWLVWLTALLVVTLGVTASRYRALVDVEDGERMRLAGNATRLARLLDFYWAGTLRAAQDAADDVRAGGEKGASERRLAKLRMALPGAIAVRLSDAHGRLLLEHVDASANTDAVVLTLRVPVPSISGLLTVDIGAPAFQPVIASALYADDMAVSLRTPQGRFVVQATTLQASVPTSPDEIKALRVWTAQSADPPLQLELNRTRIAVRAQWRDRTFVAIAVWTSVFIVSAVAIVLAAKRRYADWRQRRDHTAELTEALNATRRSDERLRQVVRSAGIGVFETKHLTNETDTTAEHDVIWGFEPASSITLEDYKKRIHQDDVEAVMQRWELSRDPKGNGLFDSEHRIVRPDGSIRRLRVRAQTVFDGQDESRQAIRTVGGVTDITDSYAVNERMRLQAALLDQAQDAISIRQLDGRIMYWNGGAERVYGWTAAEVMGRDSVSLQLQDPETSTEISRRLLSSGEYAAVLSERCKDGTRVMTDGRYKLLRDDQGQPRAFFSIKTDVTNKLELEARLRQSQRLEAVGQLTGGVAHDFNNLLTVVLGNVELLAEQLADQPQQLRMAEMACMAARRGAELTHGLLAFSRKQPLQPCSVNLNDTLVGMESLLRHTLPANVELEVVRGAGLWSALVDPAQFESAVLNLVINGRDAIRSDGKITLETGNAYIDQDYADIHDDVQPGQYVRVTVTDTGVGMTSEQLSRAFEPFFTTKGLGKGTGLGLSMVYGFVKQSQGHVKLYSEFGHGTSVRIYLPRSDDAPGPHREPQKYREEDFRGTETVLFVEDDPLVRAFAKDVLERLGYRVLDAKQGPEALQILRTVPGIAILFTDVVLPGGMNGRELAEAALALAPRLRLLFTSGYTENAIVHHGRLDRGVHLLSKPYRSIELARKLREAIEDESSGGST